MTLTARVAAAVMAACIAVSPAAAAGAEAKKKAPACVKGADETALQMRVVQTDLMVAALSCSASDRYNAFVKGDQKTLMAAHTQLQAFFKKRGGTAALNSFITRIANESSSRSIADIRKFCEQSGWMYDAILNPARVDLPTFVAPLLVAQLHGFTPCEPRATYVVFGPKGPVEVAAAQPAAPAGPTPPANPAPAPGDVPTPKPKPAIIAQR